MSEVRDLLDVTEAMLDENLTMVLTREDAAKILGALIYGGRRYEGTRKRFDAEVDRAMKRWFADRYGPKEER